MSHLLHRRGFLQTSGVLGAAVGLWGLRPDRAWAADAPKGTPHAAKLGWRVACCNYTFRQFTFCETLGKIAQLGLNHVEGFTWQPFSPEHRDVKTDASMPEPFRKEMRQRLDDAGMEIVSCYLGDLPNNEDVARKTFEFGKQIGLKTFVAEPPRAAFDLLEKLCDEYQINVAIHNHPKPSSQYWNPQTVVDVCRGRSRRIGCCADTGHWVRSGLKPVDALRLLEGRLITFHLKDIVEFGVVGSEDCPWGEGKGDIRGVLEEVHRQKAKVVFGIEYERPGEIVPDLVKSIAYLEQVAAALGG